MQRKVSRQIRVSDLTERENMSNNSSSSSGIGFFGLLTIVFIVLKLTGYIAWSWWLVLAPIWLPLTIILTIVICVGLLMVPTTLRRKKR
jgi:hypothetical protein